MRTKAVLLALLLLVPAARADGSGELVLRLEGRSPNVSGPLAARCLRCSLVWSSP
jgi:hypothetical protein